MRVRDVMHAPAVTCTSATTLHDAARRMVVAEIGTLVVTDEHGHAIGVLTDRDLAVRGYAYALSPKGSVDRVMTHTVRTVSPDDDVFDAVHLMAAAAVRRLAVVDERRTVIGVIALDDIAMLLSKELAELTTTVHHQVLGEPATWGDWDGG